MSVSNTKYNEILRLYDAKRLRIYHEKTRRQKEVYEKIPRIKEIDDAISALSIDTAKSLLLADNNSSLNQFKDKLNQLKHEKEELLVKNFPPNFLEPDYECLDCHDTGFIENERCHCFKKRIIEALYEQSNLKEILSNENFGTFNLRLYDNTTVDPTTGLTPLENITRAIDIANDFIDTFSTDHKNLFIYGATGVGKTFLTNCIAKKLMDNSISVIYISAIKLFDILADTTFGRADKDSDALYLNIFDCDLLIIDDLGTELVNSFTASSLFNCINERYLNHKSVIISTNMSLSDIRAAYSERVFSRITSNYSLIKIFGDDLRLKRSLESSSKQL